MAASWITGHPDQGGSTIDQQLAKNLYTGGHSGFTQVLEQLALAVKLNQTYSRPEILRMYAEIAYYGHGYYGLEAASCGYFGRPPDQLTLVQAAMLAGVVNAPTYDDPLDYPRAGPGPAGARHRPDGRGGLPDERAGNRGAQRAPGPVRRPRLPVIATAGKPCHPRLPVIRCSEVSGSSCSVIGVPSAARKTQRR